MYDAKKAVLDELITKMDHGMMKGVPKAGQAMETPETVSMTQVEVGEAPASGGNAAQAEAAFSAEDEQALLDLWKDEDDDEVHMAQPPVPITGIN